jgi:hypothetical protein
MQHEQTPGAMRKSKLQRLFELASVLVRFDHVARIIVTADHGVVRARGGFLFL